MTTIELTPPPREGTGVNRWTYERAVYLLSQGVSPEESYRLIWDASPRGNLRERHREIKRAIENAASAGVLSNLPGKPLQRAHRRPERDSEAIAAIASDPDAYGAADLWEESPVRIERETPAEILNLIFSPTDLICAGPTPQIAHTQELRHWGDRINEMRLIVPNPMAFPTGITRDGRISARCTDNACKQRKFIVAEFDQGDLDTQAATIAHLAERMPLVMALHSGGKSLHAWYCVKDLEDYEQEKFFNYCVKHGADPALWVRCQFARLPEGVREDGTRQAVYYFNPEAAK